ncbi:Glucose-1-phosphate adenylyltransferase [Candidatus Clavichlamydia salmonicola]|uniref:sugar phosphate nucleotidyltransferase n=1 Tax=Candidatus Clavichlamydia salmonicola TaxID=469812 RepID=UPI001891A039|nr:sugar phosphate nucleotidyltransferase [Candidatus Clavichlamydia salmonicola]MBF5050990.1 Glucose-1-phosphate adenylyltransferase [Candidatus Clavichlamydia salmonicola]
MHSNKSFFKNYFLPQNISEKSVQDNVVVVILGGGEGKRLSPLTKSRCKPAMGFGGRYTLIDVPISHAINSGLSHIFVIGQYLSNILEEHLHKTYFSAGISQNQIKLLVPEKGKGKEYHGTADAIRKNMKHLDIAGVEYVLILSGDQLYNINFQEMIQRAKEQDVGMMIVTQAVTEKEATRMGVVSIADKKGKICSFYEKPTDPAILEKYRSQDQNNTFADKPFLGSLGIYLFRKDVLEDLLAEDDREDFGKHLIQTQIQKNNVFAYIHNGYWADVGTIKSYYNANMALTTHPQSNIDAFSCYNEEGMIFSKHHHLPGAVISNAIIKSSLLCEGSVIETAEVCDSIVGIRSVVRKNSQIHNSLILGNGSYSASPIYSSIGIGQDCYIKKAIIDENASIGNGVQLVNKQGHQEYDCPNGYLVVRDGVVIVPRGTVIPNNYVF